MLYREPTSGDVKPIFVSVNDAAKLLGLSRWTVRELIDEGALRSTKQGNRRLILTDSVEEYAKRLMDAS